MKYFLLLSLLFCQFFYCADTEITPYKYTDQERAQGLTSYKIPAASRFVLKKARTNKSDIIYYLTKPKKDEFPIAVLCGGSSLEDNIVSIIHFHRYLLKEFLDLGIGVVTIEQQGVDGDNVNTSEFMMNYTRSNRLQDHYSVINHLQTNPVKGWNGKFIFLGASEGGPLVTTLTTRCADSTIATINWCGAGDFSWKEELWLFLEEMKKQIPWYITLCSHLPSWVPFALDLYIPSSKEEFYKDFDKAVANPTPDMKLAGMTHQYHADVHKDYPRIEYDKIVTPFLVVAGEKDTIFPSAIEFVKKAQMAQAPVTFMFVEDMDHYIKKNEKVIADSFAWLAQHL